MPPSLGKSSAPQVLAPTHERQDLFLDQWPLVHHLPVARSDHEVTACHQCSIASTVLLEVGVPLAAVGLQNEPIADEEVDAADSGDQDLSPHPDVPASERESRESLDPGLRLPVVESEESSTARGGEKQADDVIGIQDVPIDDRIDHDDGRSQVKALDRKGECGQWIVDPSCVVQPVVRPMEAPTRARRHRDS